LCFIFLFHSFLLFDLYNKPHLSLSAAIVFMAKNVPSCWSQPSALRTAHGLLHARHLHPVLYTDCSVVDTECRVLPADRSVFNTLALCPVPGLLRARHLTFRFMPGLLRARRFLSLCCSRIAPCSAHAALFRARIAPRAFLCAPPRSRIAPCSTLGLLRRAWIAPCSSLPALR